MAKKHKPKKRTPSVSSGHTSHHKKGNTHTSVTTKKPNSKITIVTITRTKTGKK